MRFFNAQTGIVALLIVVIAVTVWSYKYFGRYKPFADLMGRSNVGNMGIQLQVNDAVISGRQSGKQKWRVAAKSISISRDRRFVTVDQIHDGLLYDSRQVPVVKVSAGRATYQSTGGNFGPTQSSNIELQGGIQARVLAKNGPTISMDTLSWNAQQNTIQTKSRDTAAFPNNAGTVSGDNIQFNTVTGDMSLSHLHGSFRVGKLVE